MWKKLFKRLKKKHLNNQEEGISTDRGNLLLDTIIALEYKEEKPEIFDKWFLRLQKSYKKSHNIDCNPDWLETLLEEQLQSKMTLKTNWDDRYAITAWVQIFLEDYASGWYK